MTGTHSTPLQGPLTFVLGAGAAQGAVQVGQLQAVRDAGAAPQQLVGSSVGALNAAVVALDPQGGVDRLDRTWRTLRPQHLLRRPRNRRILPLIDPTGLRSVVDSVIPAGATFGDLAVPLAVVVAERGTGRRRLVRDGPLAPALMAACAVPLLLPSVDMGGARYVDGGGRVDLPLAEAFGSGARAVVAFPTTRWPRWVGFDGYRSSGPVDDARILVLDGALPPGGGWTLRRVPAAIHYGRAAATRQLSHHRGEVHAQAVPPEHPAEPG